MPQKILILQGSPKKDGNTSMLVDWFCDGAKAKGAETLVVHTAFLQYKTMGCLSCRACQKNEAYACVILDEATPILKNLPQADVIVLATPLYFFGPSAQLKVIMDRMFSLYKWDNDAGTMKTPLKGKTLVLLASAFEELGLDVLEKPFTLVAEYTQMKFESLVIGNAGVSGHLKEKTGVRDRVIAFGAKAAG